MRLAWLLGSMLAASGCSAILGIDDLEVSGDAGVDGGDGGDDLPAPLRSFGDPTLVGVLSSSPPNDSDATFAADLDLAYFARSVVGNSNVDVLRASSIDGGLSWQNVASEVAINDADPQLAPRLSLDGLTLTYSCQCGGANLDLFITTRASVVDDFPGGEPLLVSFDLGDERGAVFSPDQLRMYVCVIDDAGSQTIYRSERASVDQPFARPEAIDLGRDACDPWISPDERRMVFSAGDGAVRNLFEVRRASRFDPWDAPSGLPFLAVNDSAALDTAPWLSPDLSVLYFTSDRFGDRDIFRAEAP